MKTLRYNGVNVFNPIETKREKIIKYFIDFYGEQHRQRIENAYDHTTFLFVPKFNKADESLLELFVDYKIKMQIKKIRNGLLGMFRRCGEMVLFKKNDVSYIPERTEIAKKVLETSGEDFELFEQLFVVTLILFGTYS